MATKKKPAAHTTHEDLPKNPEEHSREQRPDRVPLSPPGAGEREKKLQKLIAEGNPHALALDAAGEWRTVRHSNVDGEWQVAEFSWPQTPHAVAAAKALGLHEEED